MVLIAPSLLSADFLNLKREIKTIELAGADRLHLDIMDGHFVPNLTFGYSVVRAIKSIATIPLDVHLMISNAESFLDKYISCGSDIITVHAEGVTHLESAVRYIKSHNRLAGVALNPSTHESCLEYVIDDLDQVLVMSVNPGFSNQKFITSAVSKISAIKSMIDASNNKDCLIAVDGGIDNSTASKVIKNGASILVSGSYIFESSDYKSQIDKLRNTL